MISTSQRLISGALAGLASAVLVATASPVAAARHGADNTTAPMETQKAADAPPVAKRYCVDEQTTGSRLTKRVCKTKSEWQADGVDITKS